MAPASEAHVGGLSAPLPLQLSPASDGGASGFSLLIEITTENSFRSKIEPIRKIFPCSTLSGDKVISLVMSWMLQS